MTHKSAFITIVGRPNTGKSTLLNALVGKKIAITSQHPNTTRRAIRGIVTRSDFQLIFVDTPGLHKPKTLLGGALNEVVNENLDSVDLIIQCIPATDPIGSGDAHISTLIASQNSAAKICVITMVDRVDKRKLPEQLIAASNLAKSAGFEWDEIVPISALTGNQVELLIELLAARAPEGPAFYPSEMISDQEIELEISELIREATIANLLQEVPHSIAVVVDEISEREDGKLLNIHASLIVERDSQKGIIIGKQGANLKTIGARARSQIEARLGRKIFLALHVKVIPNWQRDAKALSKLGFIQQ
jgi:GTP-binding protein Era